MEIRDLKETTIQTVVDCLVKSFEGYFVPMPSDVSFWETRFKAARVDWELSYGIFDNGKLVGFIINGIDIAKGELTAYNTGTGVLPAYRGKGLVDKMYEYAAPFLQSAGVKRYQLEVIDQNHRAIKVYERIGFTNVRRIKCYRGEIALKKQEPVQIRQLDLSQLAEIAKNGTSYSWDNTTRTVLKTTAVYDLYQVLEENDNPKLAYFVINASNGYIAQLESPSGNWDALLQAIRQVTTSIRINNIDSQRTDLIAALEAHGIENSIDQFEMEMNC